MILTLDVGNSQIFGGVFHNRELTIRFRKPSLPSTSSDELGLFLRAVLRENGGDPAAVEQIAFCSVVPEIIYSLRSCCRKYFGLDPFILQAGVKTGLKIGYRNPLEVGPDRIANVIAATHLYPGRNLIIIDFGTATTFEVVRATREYLGGVILPGLRISMEALEKNTARLPKVEIISPTEIVGRSTVECIQSGLYFGTKAVVHELTREIRDQAFQGEPARVIGTGGFSRLFEREKIFDVLVPDLILVGLERALSLNYGASGPWRASAAEIAP
ncbi:MAG: type III pantothenate kinase [Gemmatimonadaceae bacterium]